MSICRKIGRLGAGAWALGFVCGGINTVMESDHLDVKWVKMPKDRWFADPFVLDVTDDEIILLVEDYAYATEKGIISLLHINRATMEIVSRKVLLELPTHLSFPAIYRKDGHVYVYPESAGSGHLEMYEYDTEKEELTSSETICDDVVWDSYITEAFGEPLMFTAANNDKILDIYKWDEKKGKFVPYQQVLNEMRCMRMGGAIFKYNGEWYYPAQNCTKRYGGAVDIKKIDYHNGIFSCETIKHIESTNKRYPLGLHTLNEYKGIVVIDVKGFRFRMFGTMVKRMVDFRRRIVRKNIFRSRA